MSKPLSLPKFIAIYLVLEALEKCNQKIEVRHVKSYSYVKIPYGEKFPTKVLS